MTFWGKVSCYKVHSFGLKGPRFFIYYQKPVHGTFLIFRMKLQQHKDLELTQMVFFGGSCAALFGQK